MYIFEKRMLELEIEFVQYEIAIDQLLLKIGLIPFIIMLFSVLLKGFNDSNIIMSMIIFFLEGIILLLLIFAIIKYKFILYKYKKLLKGEIVKCQIK